ncbi:MAG: type transport system permease protein, partial [Nocardioides sp.]|nr:type transport system permease protein [Nocardioides sp.]
TYQQYVQTVTAQGTSGDSVEKHISFGHSAAYWAVLLVVAVVSAALVFRRRDVT